MFDRIFGRSNTQGASSITWHNLNEIIQIDELIKESANAPILIFKHSVTCGTSAMAIDRLQRKWEAEEMSGIKTYYLDLLTNRQVSNHVAETFDIRHESPQVLIISDGRCIYENSHMGISYPEIRSVLTDLESV